MSVLKVYWLWNSVSGAIYSGVPTLKPSKEPFWFYESYLLIANPKSANFGIPSVTNILAGFMSLCMISILLW